MVQNWKFFTGCQMIFHEMLHSVGFAASSFKFVVDSCHIDDTGEDAVYKCEFLNTLSSGPPPSNVVSETSGTSGQ